MTAPAETSRTPLIAGIGCYFLWGLMPALFIVMGRAGASSWEILGQRALWSAPWALALVLAAGHWPQVAAVLRQPRTLALLALSGALIGLNWAVYVWAVAHNRNLEASLGYYINPLLNMAAGAFLFRERIDRFGQAAIALAAAGVLLQALALGHPPWISLVLALSFGTYGLIRKQVAAEAQVGLFIECALMLPLGLAYAIWLYRSGGGVFGHSLGGSALMAMAGPATAFPLALFAWAARRLPFSTLGFLQFIGPTMGFVTGLVVGEPLTPLRAVSFVFIWAGAAVFALGAWRAGRRLQAVMVEDPL
ncbi:MAG TPA: EamA family transporter RarD [Caulobacteraceae bacterium]|nr:EamA family transporter RarD [Caulobacteraceae bacterium]